MIFKCSLIIYIFNVMKYVYIVVLKTFYQSFNHREIMLSDCFEEPKVFTSFSKAKTSLLHTAEIYTNRGWSGVWQEISMGDLVSRSVVFTQQATNLTGDGRYVLYILKVKVNYFS